MLWGNRLLTRWLAELQILLGASIVVDIRLVRQLNIALLSQMVMVGKTNEMISLANTAVELV